MKFKYLFFIGLITLSCSSGDNKKFEIDPRTFAENKITLSKIADDIRYVPLDNSIPFNYFKYVITHDWFYIAAKGIGILKFDRRGKLVKKIGTQGRGPGEFLYGINFTVDDKTGNVFILDQQDITKVYSENGTFLREISLNKIVGGSGWGGDVEIFNSLLFFPNSLGEGDSKYCWAFLDTLGKLVEKKNNSLPPFQTNMGLDGNIYRFGNNIFYYNFYNDTIFSISPDLSYEEAYLFARGDHRWPKTVIEVNSISQVNSLLYNLFQPFSIFETNHFIVILYGYLDKEAFAFLDKETKKTFLAFRYVKSQSGYRNSIPALLNDLDGGVPLENLRYYSENGEEYITSLIEPIKLKSYVSIEEFAESVAKYPEKKKELKKLADSLKETDNPVLIMVRLKK